jgi:hypothetical protein
MIQMHRPAAFSLPKLQTPEPARLVDNLLRYLPDSAGHPGRQWRLCWTLVKALWLLDYPRGHEDTDAMVDETQVRQVYGWRLLPLGPGRRMTTIRPPVSFFGSVWCGNRINCSNCTCSKSWRHGRSPGGSGWSCPSG